MVPALLSGFIQIVAQPWARPLAQGWLISLAFCSKHKVNQRWQRYEENY